MKRNSPAFHSCHFKRDFFSPRGNNYELSVTHVDSQFRRGLDEVTLTVREFHKSVIFQSSGHTNVLQLVIQNTNYVPLLHNLYLIYCISFYNYKSMQ